MGLSGIEITSPGDETEQYLAKTVLEILNRRYPNHPWLVGFAKDTVFVKHAACDQRYGMVLPNHFSYSDLRDNALKHAGELLERAGLTRGAWDGEMGKSFEK